MPIFLWSTVVSQSSTQARRYPTARGSRVVVAMGLRAPVLLGDRQVAGHGRMKGAEEGVVAGLHGRDDVRDRLTGRNVLAVEIGLDDADVMDRRVVVRELDAEVLAGRDLEAVRVELDARHGSELDGGAALAAVRRRLLSGSCRGQVLV